MCHSWMKEAQGVVEVEHVLVVLDIVVGKRRVEVDKEHVVAKVRVVSKQLLI